MAKGQGRNVFTTLTQHSKSQDDCIMTNGLFVYKSNNSNATKLCKFNVSYCANECGKNQDDISQQ